MLFDIATFMQPWNQGLIGVFDVVCSAYWRHVNANLNVSRKWANMYNITSPMGAPGRLVTLVGIQVLHAVAWRAIDGAWNAVATVLQLNAKVLRKNAKSIVIGCKKYCERMQKYCEGTQKCNHKKDLPRP